MLNNNREDEYSKIEEGNGTESTKHTERKEFIKCSLIAAGVVIVLFSVVLSIYFAVTDKRVDNKVSAGTMRYSVIGFDPTTKKYSGGIYMPTEYTPSTSDFFDLYTVTDNINKLLQSFNIMYNISIKNNIYLLSKRVADFFILKTKI